MRRAVEHRVERFFTRLAQTAGLVVAADDKDRVVRSGGDRQQHQHVVGEGRQTHDVVVAHRSDHTAGRGQLDEDHGQHDQHGAHRPVDEQQHHQDDQDGDQGDFRDAFLTRVRLVGDQRTRPGDIGLDTRRCGHRVHDFADGLAGLGAQTTAHVAGQVHLDVRGLLVVALRARGGQRIAPEILDVLNVLLVLLQALDDLVVVVVGLGPQRLVAL